MVDDNIVAADVKLHTSDEQGNAAVLEGETQQIKNDDLSSSNVTESNQQNESTPVENQTDPVSNITQQTEELQINSNNEPSVPVVSTETKTDAVTDNVNNAVDTTQNTTNEGSATATENLQENAQNTDEIKQDIPATVEAVEDQAKETAQDVQEKSAELTDDAKQTAQDVNANAQEITASAEKTGEQKLEQAKASGEVQSTTTTVQEKTSDAAEDAKQNQTSQSAAIIPDNVTEEGTVTEPSPLAARNSNTLGKEQAASAPARPGRGPISAIRNFFGRLFRRNPDRRKSKENPPADAPVETTDAATKSATLATTNPPSQS